MADVPAPLTYGTITGTFISVSADSTDSGERPDSTPLEGTVTITPNARVFRITASDGQTQLAVASSILARVVNGSLVADDGITPLRVLASDSPGLNPSPIQYTAQFNFAGVVQQPDRVVFNVPSGGTVNLAAVISLTPASPVQTVVSEVSRVAAEAAADDAEYWAGVAQSAAGGGGLTDEQVRDLIGMTLTAGSNIVITPDDTGNVVLISTPATINASDAALRARASHTGTQTASTISDLPEAVQDILGGTVVGGTNVSVVYDDANGTLTISAAGGGGGGLDTEAVQDVIAATAVAGTNITLVYNDANGTLTFSTPATVNSPDATLLARANHTGTQSADTIVDGSTNKVFTGAEKTKLGTVASNATANSNDATLLARANHTGLQAQSTVINLTTDLASAKTAVGTSFDPTGLLVIDAVNVQEAFRDLDAGAVDYDEFNGKIEQNRADQTAALNLVSQRIDPIDEQLMQAKAARIVIHGATAGTLRPAGTLPVVWYGTVAPTNAVNNDIYHNTSTAAITVINITADTTPPAVPTITMTAGDGTLSATFGTVADSDFNHYEYRYGTTNPPTSVPVSTTLTTLSLSGATNGTTYYAQVRSVDATGNASAWSAAASATPTAPVSNVLPTDGIVARWNFNTVAPAVGSPVGAVTDSVGGYPLSPGASSPTVVAVGSKKGVRFDGVDDFLQNTSTNTPYLQLAQPSTQIVVGRYRTATPASKPFVASASNTAGTRTIVNSSADGKWQANSGTTVVSATPIDTNAHVITARFNGASSSIDVDATRTTGNMGTDSRAGVRVAYNTAGNAWSDIDVYEIIIYNRVLTDAEVASARGALAAYWGI